MTDLLRGWIRLHLRELFDQHRVVVWEDDSGVLESLLREELPAGVAMPRYEGNPLSLRLDIDRDAFLEKKWLLYVPPLPEGVHSDWLFDYQMAFHRLPEENLAGVLHRHFNVKQSPELRRALTGDVARQLALRFDRFFPGDAEKLTEEEIFRALLFAAVDSEAGDEGDIVLRYLTSRESEGSWKGAGLLAALTALIRKSLGLKRNLAEGGAPDSAVLVRCLVASSLVESGAADAKPMANYLPSEGFRPRWNAMMKRGLMDAAVREPLLALIGNVLRSSDLLSSLTDPRALAKAPALPQVDARLFELLVEGRPAADSELAAWWAVVAQVAEARLRVTDGPTRAGWATLQAAAAVLHRVRQRLSEIESYPADCFERLAQEYAAENGDWEIDALYRRLHRGADGLPKDLVELLVAPARDAYHRFVRETTRRFVGAVEAHGAYAAKSLLPQTRFWNELVSPGPATAVLVVDALRADLAHDLARTLRARGHRVETRAALAELPTRTEVGMAALLQGAQEGFAVRVEKGELVPYLGALRLAGTTARRKHMEEVGKHERKVVRRELERFIDEPAALAECLRTKSIPVAHTTDVDEGGEMAAKVDFGFFDTVLEQCARFVDLALAAGFARVAVASDHGFLVRDPGSASVGIPGTPSAGGAFARGLRYAMGSSENPKELLRLPAAMLGRSGDDVFVPRDTGCLALQGGAGLFVHGGLSRQECALLFLTVLPGASDSPGRPDVAFRVEPLATSLSFPVLVLARGMKMPLFSEPLAVRVVVTGEGSQTISETVSVAPEAADREHKIVVSVKRAGEYTVSFFLGDEERPHTTLPVKVEVLGDDFGF